MARRMIRAVVAATVLACAACSQAPAETDASGSLDVQVTFTGLWWSEAQMDGLNPNNPPPKTTEVELRRWEYSDPVGVPHPDVVNAVVTLANTGSEPLSGLTVTTEGAWRVGDLRNESTSVWADAEVFATEERVDVEGGSKRTLRVPIDLKQKMDSLEPSGRWPHVLRVRVIVNQPGHREPIARAQVDFPITPGN